MDEAFAIELDKRACTELIFRLARALDRCDETLLRSLFHEDATDDHGYFKGTAGELADWVFPLLRTMERTMHTISNVLVDVSGDRAASEAYFVAYHDLRDAEGAAMRMTAAGRYLDRFERRQGVWKFSHRAAVYDWNAMEPRSDRWDRSPASERDFGKRDGEDTLYAHLAWLRH
ncbi:nuclear transport factor 2 family protein [Sphingomonas profundi]|uniref:nuclear transport factor 2 family protein n=1 Tax=Alterirhizorhabdus profundi TaxID=2681549 RepID=UPI001E450E1D|nr:nuclear transport factor 2 family protein [Sphingomonas profundi]